MAKARSSECAIDMTPMIDVVFQLIIFFIVTMKMNDEYNKEIELEMGKNGPIIDKIDPKTLILEVARNGRISIHNMTVSPDLLKRIVKTKYDRVGQFPVLIRADKRTQHTDVRRLMDICSEAGIWRINFAAIKEKKT